MNQRRESQYGRGRLAAALAVVTVLVFIAGAVYFFAIRDDDKGSGGNTTLSPQTFDIEGVPFTFTYPGNFAGVDPTPEGFVWISGIGPYDIIDVKRLANSERTLARTRTEVKDLLQTRPDVKIVGEGTETTGAGLKLVRFDVETTVAAQTLQSSLYYFSMAGASWQLECQSTAAGRAEIGAACVNALATFRAK